MKRRTPKYRRRNKISLSRKCGLYYTQKVYGGSCCSRNGTVEVGFLRPKHFISLYSKPERIDFNGVESMLCATMVSEEVVC